MKLYTGVGKTWAAMSDVAKGMTVLFVVISSVLALSLQLYDYRDLPERVDLIQEELTINRARIPGRMDAVEDAVAAHQGRLSELESLVNDVKSGQVRIICYLERAASNQNPIACAN